MHSLNPKAKYKNDQEAQKVSARVSYARNPKIRIGHSYCILRMKQRFLQKKRDKYSLCEPKLPKIEMYLHAGCLLKMARSIQSLQIKGKNDFGKK